VHAGGRLREGSVAWQRCIEVNVAVEAAEKAVAREGANLFSFSPLLALT
jgi:hypothetical protein